jgi:hypothetical protein
MRGNQEQGYHNQHLYVRFVRTYDLAIADPIFERFTVQLPLQTTSNADPFRLWGESPPPWRPSMPNSSEMQLGPFFTGKLLDANSFA